MPRNVSKTLSLLLKIAFAAGVIYWMAHSGKLNLDVVGRAFQKHWLLALFLVFTLYLQIAIISWRMEDRPEQCLWDRRIRYREAFSLSA